MKIRDGYQKVKLAGETYIMPFGQNAADRTHSLKLNETSVFLWAALVYKRQPQNLTPAFSHLTIRSGRLLLHITVRKNYTIAILKNSRVIRSIMPIRRFICASVCRDAKKTERS